MKKMLILAGLVTVALLAACVMQKMDENPEPVLIYPTATSHFFFESDSTAAPPPTWPSSQSGTPTVASVFHVYPTSTPFFSILDETLPAKISTPIAEQVETQVLASKIFNVSVYKDELNPNWEVQKSSGVEIYLNDSNRVYKGQSAISFTPYTDYGILFLTVTGESQELYPRDRVTQLSFWLYSGEDRISLDQLSIAIVSSNSPTYWSANDHPMINLDEVPVLSETRSYTLPLNRAVPANTWVLVELDFDKTHIVDPDYRYLTGFYLKTEPGLSRTLVIDDITLEMVGDGPETPAAPPQELANQKKLIQVQIDPVQAVHPISELIYGVSGAPAGILKALRPALNSWGGSASSRYNWEIGHAWNAGAEDLYRNGNYGFTSGSASDDFISQSLAEGAEVRFTLPTLGWVAKNDDPNTCSFPLPDGSCGDADGATCQEPGEVADPYQANVPSYLTTAMSLVDHLQTEKEWKIRFIAMDHEPELWGVTHYDVHPECTTYDEILRRYSLYATYMHSYAPEVELAGPVTSGWNYYWDSAAGKTDKLYHANQDFLPWFLRQVQMRDKIKGWRSLHVLDLHYYPENVYNGQIDDETSALRLRSTRSLWDERYVDESSIAEPVYLIPRMKELIEKYYPGTKLGLSEWNWGAEKTMNGALAIADVLGIFGREDLYYAAYWTYPPISSPGFFAFKMYTNYNDRGGRFGDTSVFAKSGNVDVLGSYAALDSLSGDLRIMLLNKQAADETLANIELRNFAPNKTAEMYRYDGEHPEGIKESTMIVSSNQFSVNLPAYSITLLVIHPQK
jgi:hypothetical protein